MSDFIKEKKTVWQVLSESSKAICIYGMGDGALKILNVFKKYNIKCSGIFASDNYVRGHKFAGFDVLTYNDLKEKYGDFIIIMGFAINTDKMFNYIQELSNEHQVFSPDTKILGESTGVPGLFVIFAIIVGGGLFGVIGMVIGVPTISVIIYVFRSITNNIFKKRFGSNNIENVEKDLLFLD